MVHSVPEEAQWALTPEHLCDEHLSAFPADRAILAHRAHNITLVVPNLRKMMREVPDDGVVQRDRGPHEKRLMRTPKPDSAL